MSSPLSVVYGQNCDLLYISNLTYRIMWFWKKEHFFVEVFFFFLIIHTEVFQYHGTHLCQSERIISDKWQTLWRRLVWNANNIESFSLLSQASLLVSLYSFHLFLHSHSRPCAFRKTQLLHCTPWSFLKRKNIYIFALKKQDSKLFS